MRLGTKAQSFQESAESWKAKTHVSAIKSPVLIGICALALFVLFLMFQGLWHSVNQSSFALSTTEEALPQNTETTDDASSEKGEDFNSDTEAQSHAKEAEDTILVVHIEGAVCTPGVYELKANARLSDAIVCAGGFRDDAAPEGVNLARMLTDGEQVIVPTKEQYETGMLPSNSDSAGIAHASSEPALVNINSASLSELTTLPGVGEATAQKIINEREQNGLFSSPEDIMRVSGIGEKKFTHIQALICV